MLLADDYIANIAPLAGVCTSTAGLARSPQAPGEKKKHARCRQRCATAMQVLNAVLKTSETK